MTACIRVTHVDKLTRAAIELRMEIKAGLWIKTQKVRKVFKVCKVHKVGTTFQYFINLMNLITL